MKLLAGGEDSIIEADEHRAVRVVAVQMRASARAFDCAGVFDSRGVDSTPASLHGATSSRRILIADAHEVEGRGSPWPRLLPGCKITSARSCADLLDLTSPAKWRAASHDILITDWVLPDGYVRDVLPSIAMLDPRPEIAIVSSVLTAESVLQALRFCRVVLPKPLSAAAAAGLVSFLEKARSPTLRSLAFADKYALSRQETRALAVAVSGGSRAEAATTLKCSKSTVASYWSRILDKTGMASELEVVVAVLTSEDPGL